MEKTALIERLVRLGATDVPNTPRLLMKHRSPGELAQLQQGVTNAFGKIEAPLKQGLGHITSKLPGKLQGPVRWAGNKAIENPEFALPGGGAMVAGKKLLERGIDKLAPVPKLAFTVSQYSGALNPVIHSGASVLPPFKAPRLDTAIQKAAFATSQYDAGPAPTWAHAAASPSGASYLPSRKVPRLDVAVDKTAAGAPTRGNFMMASDIPPFKAPRLDKAIQKDGAYEAEPYTSIFKGAKLVKLEGDAIIEVDKRGKSLGKGNLLKEKGGDALPEGIAMQPWDSFRRSKYASMSTEKLAEFVAELRKEAIPGLTPQSRLEHSTRIGAPRATPPPGPSIAAIAKPAGPGWGSGIAGAGKGSVSGGSVGGIGPMKSPPQL